MNEDNCYSDFANSIRGSAKDSDRRSPYDFEGGSKSKKREDKYRDEDEEEEEEERKDKKFKGEDVKNMFHETNIVGTQHLQKKTHELMAGANSERTGFMKKEQDFIDQLKEVQGYHIQVCCNLMKGSIVSLFIELVFSLFSMFYFGCGFGDCQNGLVCSVYYLKFFQSVYLINTYMMNIKENQPNHPISQLNAFIVLLLYYICLYIYLPGLSPEEDPMMIHYLALFVGLDGLTIALSMCAIKKVKAKANKLIEDPAMQEY